jgi:hypothetical protein
MLLGSRLILKIEIIVSAGRLNVGAKKEGS